MKFHSFEKYFSDQPTYRLTQTKKAIFQDLIRSWEEATTFPKELREKLRNESPISIDAQLHKTCNGDTVKALIKLHDGEEVETVLMKHKGRNTVCVSTQIGCPLKCGFCATGKMGFTRDLDISEIVEQIVFFSRHLKEIDQKVTNVVFMGMGEPFLNYENVISTIRYLNEKETLNLGMRHFSISTSGIPDKIREFADEDMEVNLAISLHAGEDELRSKLMPVNNTYSLEGVLDALAYYQEKRHRKLMFEYIMIDGVNDTLECAGNLINIAKRYMCIVNLIPCNPSPKTPYKPSKTANILKFKKLLEKANITVVQRFTYGNDIAAACGQLANKPKNRTIFKH